MSDLSKEKNYNINDSIKQNNSKSLIKSENNKEINKENKEENNNENNIFEISLNSSKKMNI